MDLTKPVMNCVTSIYPRVFYDLSDPEKANTHTIDYIKVMEKFIKRVRAEHEDETNFKLV